MDNAYRVNITSEALADIQSIFDYIETNSPQNASTMIERILDAVDELDSMPTRFKVVGHTDNGSPVHGMVVRPFIVYYRVEESPKAVFIVAIQHGARQQPRHFS